MTMAFKFKATAIPDSDEEDSLSENEEKAQKRIRLMREHAEHDRSKRDRRFVGGIVVSSDSESKVHSASASLSAAEKKGLKEVEELERELDLKNTFSKETNRRDEDAEMNKYIDEQIRQRREAAKREREKRFKTNETTGHNEEGSELEQMFTLPTAAVADAATEKVDDILLHTLAKNYSTTTDEKSEAMLSSQMLNGIPEVDLGLSEKIRTIEATEEAKLSIATSTNSSGDRRHHSSRKSSSIVPINFSSNFQNHRTNRDKNDGELRSLRGPRDSRSAKLNGGKEAKTISEPVVSVGEEPKEVEYRVPTTNSDHRPPMKGRASDDYYLQKFKNNSRR